MHNVIDIHTLADKAGYDTKMVRLAGQGLFEALSSEEPDLKRALIEASAASGMRPEGVLQILTIFAEDFRQPVGQLAEDGGNSLAAHVQTMASVAKGGAIAAAEKARETIASIDLAGAKERGAKVLGHIRDEVDAIDVENLKDRANSAGEFLAAKARSLASVVRKDEQSIEASSREEER